MIKVGTFVNIVDNSGAKVGYCIKVLGGKKAGSIGDKIILIVRKAKTDSKVKKKMVYYGMIMRTSKIFIRKDGSQFKFDRNSVVLLNKKLNPIASKIKGPVLKELREDGLVRLMSMSSVIL